MTCCPFFLKCLPNGSKVGQITDTETGSVTYWSAQDGSQYTGDVSLLSDCPASDAEFEYVDYSESLHAAGNQVAGLGTPDDPFQIPIQPQHAVRLEDIDPAAGTGGDDTAALYGAVDMALAERTRVQLDGKTYNFDQPIVLDIDRETFWIEGCGGESTRFGSASPAFTDGSVLNSRITTGDGFTFRGPQSTVKDLTFAGVTDGWVAVSGFYQMAHMEDIFIDAIGENTNGLRIEQGFIVNYKNIDIWKRPQNQNGIGLWHDTTTDVAGGLILFENITASFFERNLEFGQEADYVGNKRRNNTLVNVQGRGGVTGIRIGAGYGSTQVINLWGERNTYAQVQVHSGAGPVRFHGGEFAHTTGHGLAIGLDPALATGSNEAVCPVTVTEGIFRAAANFGAIRVFQPTSVDPDIWHEFDAIEIRNNGGSRILVDPNAAQVPILLRRGKYEDNFGGWNNNNILRVPDGTVNGAAYPTAIANPLAHQTTPFTQV